MRRLQQIGGTSGIVFAAALAAELVLFLLVVPALGSSTSDLNDTAKYAKLLAKGQVPFVFEGSLFAVASAFTFALVRALADRNRAASPELSAISAPFGYAGFSFLMVTFTVRVYLALDTQHAVQAIPSLAILGNALGAAGGVLLGAWVFLVSLSALSSAAVRQPLAYFGFLVALALVAGPIISAPVFIPLLLVWSLWIGLVLLRDPEGSPAGSHLRSSSAASAQSRGT